MNWNEAVEAMRSGHAVRRKSESVKRVIYAGAPDLQGEHWADGIEHAPIVESGQEGCRLMHAWTADEKPALSSWAHLQNAFFVPEDEHRNATDWEIERDWSAS